MSPDEEILADQLCGQFAMDSKNIQKLDHCRDGIFAVRRTNIISIKLFAHLF